ncbi:MAG: hypothetical protein AUK47_00255 [Deltaproteobacteria bacterium CG2_30_63_29]|nr:MAG: hypothetical protein AUK47_00255 [Deltaproteobacteria bacterium CG2_30_63_29]PIW00634.1 MAG: hypothetical protein COW42_07175 [Deltaproteobacteria bacterium CG17_big_fil_post_rev_8_21_14_2_50_63_7]
MSGGQRPAKKILRKTRESLEASGLLEHCGAGRREENLRVMTYNVRYFGHPTRGITSTESALRGIAAAIGKLNPRPDIIALQEVESHSLRADAGRKREAPQIERLVQRLNAQQAETGPSVRYSHLYFPSHTYSLTPRAALYTTGLAILVSDRIELTETQPAIDITHRRLKLTKRWKQTRICAHVSLTHKSSGERLDVYNTHLSLPQFLTWRSVTFTKQMGSGANQLYELFALLDYIEESKCSDNVLLMGDFNSLPGSLVYDYVHEHTNLADPLRDHLGLDTPDYRKLPSAGFMNFKMRLDYLFASRHLTWSEFDSSVAFGAESPFLGLSDHAPIIGRLDVPSLVSTQLVAA